MFERCYVEDMETSCNGSRSAFYLPKYHPSFLEKACHAMLHSVFCTCLFVPWTWTPIGTFERLLLLGSKLKYPGWRRAQSVCVACSLHLARAVDRVIWDG
jgi:hypothetical protein